MADDISGSPAEHRGGDIQLKVLPPRAPHDPPTDLPNRHLLHERLRQAIAAARRQGTRLAVLALDLDACPARDHQLGPAAGDDDLRCQVERRIRRLIRDGDTLAWLGGTAFAVVQNHTRRPQDAALVAGRISDALAGTFRLGRQEVRVGASVGIACYPDDGTAAAELLRRADLALDQARQAGHRSIRFFAPQLDEAVARRRAREHDLRLAPERQQLHVAYQPQVDLATRRVVGVEALLRWRRPAHGLVPPDEFIPVAEASGMIRSLGAWVLDEACAQARAWRDQGLGLQVAVNVSPAQLQLGFGELVAEVLARHALPPGQLCLELTESLLLEPGLDGVGALLERLAGLGVRVASTISAPAARR
jgi:diguanylate cyclase (GGDEF)-like protein